MKQRAITCVVALGALHGSWSADVLLDARELHVLPGVVDSQVHFREPGLTHKETLEAGTRGAVLGGVTTIFEMPNTHPLTLGEQDLRARRVIRDEWIASVSGWTPYDGCAVTGWPVHTVVRGQVVVRDGELNGQPVGAAVTFLDV